MESYYSYPLPHDAIVNHTSGAGMIFLLSLVGVVGLYFAYKHYTNKKNRATADTAVLPTIPRNVMAGSEEFAAIAAVIHLYKSELRDEEITIMTINKIARAYSPWSSKIHFQNQYFNLRKR